VSVVTSGDRDVGNFVGYVVISEVRSHRDVRMLGLSLLNVDGLLLATETRMNLVRSSALNSYRRESS